MGITQYVINLFIFVCFLECIINNKITANSNSIDSVGSQTQVPPHPSVLAAQTEPKSIVVTIV